MTVLFSVQQKFVVVLRYCDLQMRREGEQQNLGPALKEGWGNFLLCAAVCQNTVENFDPVLMVLNWELLLGVAWRLSIGELLKEGEDFTFLKEWLNWASECNSLIF